MHLSQRAEAAARDAHRLSHPPNHAPRALLQAAVHRRLSAATLGAAAPASDDSSDPDDAGEQQQQDGGADEPPPQSSSQRTPTPLTGPSCLIRRCGAACKRRCRAGELCSVDADCATRACITYPRAARGGGADELRCGCPDGLFLSVEHPAWGNASQPCVSQAEMCSNGKWDAFEGAQDCGAFCPTKCRAGQSCRGHEGCATRWCDPALRKCGCPAPLVPSAPSGTNCERVTSSKVVAPVGCTDVECTCPKGEAFGGEKASCLLGGCLVHTHVRHSPTLTD